MKTPFLVASILPAIVVCSTLSAQITLEHQYPAGIGSRRLLDGTAEGYVTIDYPNPGLVTVAWYDSIHQLLQTTDVPVPTNINATTLQVGYAASQVVDSDAEIEFILQFTGATGVRYRLIDPANGQIGPEFLEPPIFFTVDGVHKMLYDTEVYAFPGLDIDHVFALAPEPVSRTVLELDGPKFWYDDNAGNLQFFNEDYTPYLTLSDVLEVGIGCTRSVMVYGQLGIDANAAIEWSLQQNCGDSTVFTYFSGDVPIATLVVPGGGFFQETMHTPDRFPELDHPVAMLARFTPTMETFFFNVATSALEHYEAGRWISRPGTDDIGLKYTLTSIAAAATTVSVLNADYSVWNTFPKAPGVPYNALIPGGLLYDADPSNGEILGRGPTPNLPLNNTGYHVQRVDGTVLLAVDTANRSSFIYIAGRQNKLLLGRHNIGDPALNFTRVYALPSFTSPVGEPAPNPPAAWTFGAHPNPVLDLLRLTLPALDRPGVVHVRNAAGRDVYRQRLAARQTALYVPAADWSPGVYAVDVQIGAERAVRLVVKL